MAKVYVFSTLTCDQQYTQYIQGGADLPVVESAILIKGGAGVAGVANDRLITPLGVCTEIDDRALAMLETNADFVQHKANGFITVDKKAADADLVAVSMQRKDGSAPLTPNDYLVKNEAAPLVNAVA